MSNHWRDIRPVEVFVDGQRLRDLAWVELVSRDPRSVEDRFKDRRDYLEHQKLIEYADNLHASRFGVWATVHSVIMFLEVSVAIRDPSPPVSLSLLICSVAVAMCVFWSVTAFRVSARINWLNRRMKRRFPTQTHAKYLRSIRIRPWLFGWRMSVDDDRQRPLFRTTVIFTYLMPFAFAILHLGVLFYVFSCG